MYSVMRRVGISLMNNENDEKKARINRIIEGIFIAVVAGIITPEQSYRKSGYVERKRRPYQENVAKFA